MSILAPTRNSHIEPVEKQKCFEQPIQGVRSPHSKQPSLLQAIIDSFFDGVLILTKTGEWVHANECARRICRQLSQHTSQVNSVPQPIWRVCESLIESRELFPQQKMIIESEIDTANSTTFRIRVRWLELDASTQPYLLAILEDQYQSTQNAANTDAKKYGLTPREAEVWSLKRANYSYKEIAAQLYIGYNTVKKHLKNIYAKQQELHWTEQREV